MIIYIAIGIAGVIFTGVLLGVIGAIAISVAKFLLKER